MRITLGISGSIAAYKACELVRCFVKAGDDVRVVMTEAATKFVTPLTFQTLSRNPVVTSLWEEPEWRPEHVALADEADLFVVVPATANFLAKYAHGIADDALTTFAATYDGPVLLAPAMNPKMWAHPACVDNVALLKKRGVRFCGPVSGHVACGADGMGRMVEAADILAAIDAIFAER